jgi:hypothetical protein
MTEIVAILTAISIYCTPMRAGVFTMEGTLPHIQACEKRAWACIDTKRKVAAGRRKSNKPSALELEACFR